MHKGSASATHDTKNHHAKRAARCTATQALCEAGYGSIAIDYAMTLVEWAFGEVSWPCGEPAKGLREIVGGCVLAALRQMYAGTYPEWVDKSIITRGSILAPNK